MHNDPIEPQASLRKCNKISSIYMTECDTPGPLTSNGGTRETPKSMRGSSIFSPGETFWNEAIQVADGLFATNNNLSVQVAEEMKATNRQYEIRNSDILRNGEHDEKSNGVPYEGAVRVCNVGLSASLTLRREDGKTLDKAVSPLPVKHIDFSSEEKNLYEEAGLHHSAQNTSITSRVDEQTGCSSTNHKTLQKAHIRAHHIITHKGVDMRELQVTIAKRKVDYLGQDNDSITFDTPDKETKNITATHAKDEDNTPSSFLPLKDHLDIINWLPSEICSMYKKRGISKLYPWQVYF